MKVLCRCGRVGHLHVVPGAKLQEALQTTQQRLATLFEEVQFADGGVASANFDDYRILRMSENPEVNVHIVESNDDIGGIGEPGIMPLAPAVANAVFNATGGRLRRMPFTPERVLAAIKVA